MLGETTGSPVSERTIDEVEELSAGPSGDDATEPGAAWTRPMVEALSERLRENGYGDRAIVVERAVASSSGRIGRAEVLSALGRPKNAKLTGFTRAIATATKQLLEEGVLPAVAGPALWPEYDGPGKAVSFSTVVFGEPRPKGDGPLQ